MIDSIKKETDKILKEINPNLFESKMDKFIQFTNDHSKWYVIVLLIFAIFFGLQFINIPLLNFIHIDEVKSLIDSRTANIVTMISVTFAIIGFLIANLAIKESFTYNLLFKKSTFFPVSFIALSLIASFIILSTLKSAIPIDYQTRTLLAGTYLILIVVFLIGYLFTRLVKFTNQKYLLELVRKELISESKQKLLLIGKKIVSSNKILEIGFSPYSMAFYSQKSKGDFQISKDHTIITDIKLRKLTKLAKQIDINDFFVKEVCLYRKLTQTNDDGFFFVEENKLNQNSNSKILNRMNSCVITSANPIEQTNEAKDYIIQKLKENIKANNDKLVEEYFEMLLEMFRLQQDFKINLSNKEDDITNGIKTDVLKMIDKAIVSNSLESFYAIDGFCIQLLNLSISNKNIIHFKDYLDIAIYYYTLSYNYCKANNALYGKMYEQCSERAAMRIREEFLLLNFYSDKADIQTKRIYNQFQYTVFAAFSQLLYYQIMRKDMKAFNYTLNQLKQGAFFGYHYDKYDFILKLYQQQYSESELNNYKVNIQPYRYFQHTVLGIKYWLFYLYENNQVSLDELNEFVNPISQIISEEQIAPEYWEIELLFNYLNSNALDWYLNWQHWDYVKHDDGKAFWMPSVFDWIFTGIVIDGIKQGCFSNNFNVDVNLIEKQNPQNKSLLIDTFKKALDRVKQNERWQAYFDNKMDTQKIENQLKQINAKFEIQKAKEIVAAKLIPEKVQSFKSNFYNGWEKSKFIRKIFEYFDNKQKCENHDNKLFLVGLRAFLEKGKSFFLHGSDGVYGIENIATHYGQNVSYAEDRFFFQTVLKNKTEKVFNSIENGLDKSIAKFRKLKIEPTAIFLDFVQLNNQWSNEKWSNEKIIDFSTGTYDGIPVFYVRGNLLGNRFIVANFGKAFTMLYREIENAFDNVLKIDVVEITDEFAKEKLQQEPEKWKNIDGQQLSDEDALNYIKTSILLDYEVIDNFEIKDNKAFEVGLIDIKQ
jgi:hypothetical protein